MDKVVPTLKVVGGKLPRSAFRGGQKQKYLKQNTNSISITWNPSNEGGPLFYLPTWSVVSLLNSIRLFFFFHFSPNIIFAMFYTKITNFIMYACVLPHILSKTLDNACIKL